MKIVDNFLIEKNFIKLKKEIFKQTFPWYYNDTKSLEKDNNFQFVHIFYLEGKILSPYWNTIAAPILNKLDAKKLIRVKANLTTKKDKKYKSAMHVDTSVNKSKTAVYYCNTNNGYTIFDSGKEVASKENRIVIFDSFLKHCGADCTDENIRVVININYI
jgi:hypothetical protein